MGLLMNLAITKKPVWPKRMVKRGQTPFRPMHRRLTDQHGPLKAAEIQACLKPGSSVWFCGPAVWGHSLAQKLTSLGLPQSAFHQEAFEFR